MYIVCIFIGIFSILISGLNIVSAIIAFAGIIIASISIIANKKNKIEKVIGIIGLIICVVGLLLSIYSNVINKNSSNNATGDTSNSSQGASNSSQGTSSEGDGFAYNLSKAMILSEVSNIKKMITIYLAEHANAGNIKDPLSIYSTKQAVDGINSKEVLNALETDMQEHFTKKGEKYYVLKAEVFEEATTDLKKEICVVDGEGKLYLNIDASILVIK